MSTIDLQHNFGHILHALEGKGMKRTNIAREIGYTTTSQLNRTLAGESLLSTKAIMGLIENLNVNPTFLFLGKGEIFISDETEVERIQKEYSELQQKFFGNQDDLMKCKAELERAIYRYNKLIDITIIALEKTQQSDTSPEESQEE
jgi:transcriptional regulator with XRE-family HTH domain